MKKPKHYNRLQAEHLLARLVLIREGSVARARRTLTELLAARFGDPIAVGVALEAQVALRNAPDADVDTWRQVLYRLLGDAAREQRFTGEGVAIETASVSTGADGTIRFEMDGELPNLFAMQAYLLARVVGGSRLQRCDPEHPDRCGRLFVKIGNRIACSTRCTKRIYMRRFRERTKNRKVSEHDGKATRQR